MTFNPKQNRPRRCPWALAIVSVVATSILVIPGVSAQVPPAEDPPPVRARPPSADYVIGQDDVVAITVWTHDDLSGQYTVENDGTFSYPLIGRVQVAGLTLRGLETELIDLLADGLIRDPQVTVEVAEYRSRRIFVLGAVLTPGAYPLTGDETLIEALAGAGRTDAASSERVLIVRPRAAGGPVLPGEDDAAEVIEVSLRDLRAGAVSENVIVQDGDTLFVPRAEMAYVFGHVGRPGAYSIERGTTVLQALALAGGATELAALNRIKIVRTIDGTQEEIKVELNNVVEPSDTIIVPQRYF